MSAAALWTSKEADAATGGHSTRDWQASGVSIDTRTLAKGDLFIALKGVRDGHQFVGDAFKRGAAAALVSRKPENIGEAPLLVVADTQLGLEALGRAARTRSAARIVAVTGSAGKTTTKEMLRLMLSRAGSVVASAASYNNHWGVPLSLSRMARDVQFGIFEIGMNHEGEIRALVKQVRPHVALVTTVAAAHLEYFGTVEKIADAKAEIFEGLEHGGAALIPIDNADANRLAIHAENSGAARILYFGSQAGADARLLSSESKGDRQQINAEIAGKKLSFQLSVPGHHFANNAMAALLAVHALGEDPAIAARALIEFAPLKGRGARFHVSVKGGPLEIIDESYNANPASMAAALELLAVAVPAAGGRRIAVLGDMLELGSAGAALHAGLARDIECARADMVFLCGPQMEALWCALPQSRKGAYVHTSAELVSQVTAALRAGDVVLVKGSLGSRMAVIIDALKALDSVAA